MVEPLAMLFQAYNLSLFMLLFCFFFSSTSSSFLFAVLNSVMRNATFPPCDPIPVLPEESAIPLHSAIFSSCSTVLERGIDVQPQLIRSLAIYNFLKTLLEGIFNLTRFKINIHAQLLKNLWPRSN